MNERMSALDQEFGFEHGAVELSDGSLFRPLEEAQNRWSVRTPKAHRAVPGLRFEILYELPDQMFVFVQYWATQHVCQEVGGFGRRKIWQGDKPPAGRRIGGLEAREFFLRN